MRVVSLSNKNKVEWCSKVCFKSIMLLFGMVIFAGLSCCSGRRAYKNRKIEKKETEVLGQGKGGQFTEKGHVLKYPHPTYATKKAIDALTPPVVVECGGNPIKAAAPRGGIPVRDPVEYNRFGQAVANNIVQRAGDPQQPEALFRGDDANHLLNSLRDSGRFTPEQKEAMQQYIIQNTNAIGFDNFITDVYARNIRNHDTLDTIAHILDLDYVVNNRPLNGADRYYVVNDRPQPEAVQMTTRDRLLAVLRNNITFDQTEQNIIENHIDELDPYGNNIDIIIEGFQSAGIRGDEGVLRGVLRLGREHRNNIPKEVGRGRAYASTRT